MLAIIAPLVSDVEMDAQGTQNDVFKEFISPEFHSSPRGKDERDPTKGLYLLT